MGRSDYTILNDPELSFHEIVKKNLLAAVSNTLKTEVKTEKPEENIRFDRNQILFKLEKGEGTLQVEKISNSKKKENPDGGSAEVSVPVKEELYLKKESELIVEKASEDNPDKMEVDENHGTNEEKEETSTENLEIPLKEEEKQVQDEPLRAEQPDEKLKEEMEGERCKEEEEGKADVINPANSDVRNETESNEKESGKTYSKEVESNNSNDDAINKIDTELEIKVLEEQTSHTDKTCEDNLDNAQSGKKTDEKVGNPAENLENDENGKGNLREEERLKANPKDDEILNDKARESQPENLEMKTVLSSKGDKLTENGDKAGAHAETIIKGDTQPAKVGVQPSFADSFDLKVGKTDSVDKLKAMFPELEVMNRLPEIDAIVVNENKPNLNVTSPFNKGNPSLIDSSIANIFTQSYQNPIKWPKVSSCFYL